MKEIFFLIFLVFTLSNSKNIKIGIIGAGAAGLAAANKIKNSIPEDELDLKILESSGTIGGRVANSEYSNSTIIELGAQFIQGPDTEIYKILLDSKVELKEVKIFEENMENSVYLFYINKFSKLGDIMKEYSEVADFVNLVKYIFTTEDELPDISVFDYIFENEKYKFDKYYLLTLAESLISNRFGANIKKLSVKGVNNFYKNIDREMKTYIPLKNSYFKSFIKYFYENNLENHIVKRN